MPRPIERSAAGGGHSQPAADFDGVHEITPQGKQRARYISHFDRQIKRFRRGLPRSLRRELRK
jgi:hypothetical protein